MSGDRLVQPLPGYQRRLGRALWMMQDTRSRTLESLAGLSSAVIDDVPPGGDNSIGSLLYHMAAIELDWLFVDILEKEFPRWAHEVFPDDVRTDDGALAVIVGVSLEEHLHRLAQVREQFLEGVRDLSDDEYQRSRVVDGRPVTAEWVIHHLCQHEAEHRGQIQTIRSALEATRSTPGG